MTITRGFLYPDHGVKLLQQLFQACIGGQIGVERMGVAAIGIVRFQCTSGQQEVKALVLCIEAIGHGDMGALEPGLNL